MSHTIPLAIPDAKSMVDTNTGKPHNFTFPTLDPFSKSYKPAITPSLRLLLFFKRLPHVSDEHFHAWWSTVHADMIVSSPAFRKYVKRYAQLHQTPAHREMLQPMMAAAGPERCQTLQFDACVEMVVGSWEEYLALTMDEAYAGKMGPDAANFMAGPLFIFPSYEQVIYGPGCCGGPDGLSSETVERVTSGTVKGFGGSPVEIEQSWKSFEASKGRLDH